MFAVVAATTAAWVGLGVDDAAVAVVVVVDVVVVGALLVGAVLVTGSLLDFSLVVLVADGAVVSLPILVALGFPVPDVTAGAEEEDVPGATDDGICVDVLTPATFDRFTLAVTAASISSSSR